MVSLPTEVQWEYVCKKGGPAHYYRNGEAELDKVAWYEKNGADETHPVGEKRVNTSGVHDMHGNVFQWCFNSPEDYPAVRTVDWIGQRSDNTLRSLRGTCYVTPYEDGSHRCEFRGWPDPETVRARIGFRVCVRAV